MTSIFRLMLLLAVTLGSSACATRSPAPMTQVASPCDRHWQVRDAEPLALDAARPQVLRMDDRRRCGFRDDGSVATYAVFALPAYQAPWRLSLESLIDGQSLFALEAFTLDEHGTVRRSLPLDRFVMRGDRLQANLFFGQEDAADRFLLVRSAPESVGRAERQMVSSSFFLPIVNAVLPVIYVQGTESERRYTYSHGGLVQLTAASQTPPRGQPRARDLAHAELGAYLR